MKSTVLSLLFAAAAVAAPLSADAAEIILTPPTADGTFTGTFREEGIAGGDFVTIFNFEVPMAGRMAGTISSVLTSAETDIDFTSVTLNGFAFMSRASGDFEFRMLDAIAIAAGPQVLVVRGRSGGKGSYAGTLSFSPNPVGAAPEPASWALMIGGFGGAGAMLRARRRCVVPPTR